MIETDTSTLTDRFVYEPYDAATHLIGGLLGEGHSEDRNRQRDFHGPLFVPYSHHNAGSVSNAIKSQLE